MEKKILVTGGAGFIGSHLTDYLINQGHSVTILDDLSGGLERNVNPNANFIQGTINDVKLVDSLVKNVDVIYHIAAYAAEGLSPFIRRFNYKNNLLGSINLINSAIKHSVPKFLFTSSMAVYGKGIPPFNEDMTPFPDDPYGISKYAIEMDLQDAAKRFGLEFVVIRPHNIYGERQYLGDPYRNVIGIWMNRIMQGKQPLIYGDGEQTRAFSYIGDIIPCIAKAPFTKEAKNQIINLGSGKVYTLNELARQVINAMNEDIEALHAPQRAEVKHAYCTTEKSERILGFEDRVSIQEGLLKMAHWAKSVGPMDPIIWEDYELENNLPEFWHNLKTEFPSAKKRFNPNLEENGA